LFPFFFSLYLYFVIRKTGNLAVTILFHSFWNFCILAFPYVPFQQSSMQ
jgi:membrane protease YdiL (CAAX protease family)